MAPEGGSVREAVGPRVRQPSQNPGCSGSRWTWARSPPGRLTPAGLQAQPRPSPLRRLGHGLPQRSRACVSAAEDEVSLEGKGSELPRGDSGTLPWSWRRQGQKPEVRAVPVGGGCPWHLSLRHVPLQVHGLVWRERCCRPHSHPQPGTASPAAPCQETPPPRTTGKVAAALRGAKAWIEAAPRRDRDSRTVCHQGSVGGAL